MVEKDSIYKSLDSIRLLRLTPGSTSSHWELQPFLLSAQECPPFTCLSYVWGDSGQVREHSIIINGTEFPVLNSLWPFLKRVGDMPQFSYDTWWWIDSICINQADDKDKDSQVAIMKSIYERSEKTIVWLGEEIDENLDVSTRDCTGAVKSFHILVQERKLHYRKHPNEANDGKNGAQWIQETKRKYAPKRDKLGVNWKAIESFLLRPWWRRVWTLQEFIIPRKVIVFCGNTAIERQTLHNAIDFISWCQGTDGMSISRAAFDAGWNRRRILQWYNNHSGEVNKRMRKSIRLAATLAYVGNCDTTRPHDRIYSVLGLVEDSDMIGSPDYKIPVSELYTQLVQSFTAKYGSLDIICFAHYFRPPPGVKRDIPSWVPDWTVKTDQTLVMPLMASQSSQKHIGNFRPKHSLFFQASYEAAGKTSPKETWKSFDIMRNGKIFKVLPCSGIVIDPIDGLGGHKHRLRDLLGDQQQQSTSSANSQGQDKSILARHSLDSDLIEIVSRCLVLDREDRYLNRPAPVFFKHDFEAYCRAATRKNCTVHPTFLAWFQRNKSLLIRGKTLETLIQGTETLSNSSSTSLKYEKNFNDLSSEISMVVIFRSCYGSSCPRKARQSWKSERTGRKTDCSMILDPKGEVVICMSLLESAMFMDS